MKEKEIQDELTSIRNLMERSSKFISLSGLSGILAGVYALIGAGVAFFFLHYGSISIYLDATDDVTLHEDNWRLIIALLSVAALVLAASLVTGLMLSIRKAKKNGQSIWNPTGRALLLNMSIPLITGGLLMLIFLLRGYYGIVGPASLVFYGLALVNASNFTFGEVRYLGILEILLGLIAACMPGYGLLFWTIGFGVLHIIYGSVMYFKYDR